MHVREERVSVHWSCWSPPGVPSARYGSPPRATSVGESVVRGRLPGSSEFGSPSSSQNICARVPRQKPSSGITGAPQSQPPLGVAATMFPQRSTTSRCTVSPRVGSPTPGATGAPADRRREPRLAAVGRAGTQLGRGLVTDERAALVRVRRARAASSERHVEELRIAVPRLAIGERELRALGHACARTPRSRGRATRGRSPRAAAAAGGTPAPGSTAPPSEPSAPRSRPGAAARSSAPSRGGRPRRAGPRAARRAVHELALLEAEERIGDEAAIPAVERGAGSLFDSSRIRSYVAASCGLRCSAPGAGGSADTRRPTSATRRGRAARRCGSRRRSADTG